MKSPKEGPIVGLEDFHIGVPWNQTARIWIPGKLIGTDKATPFRISGDVFHNGLESRLQSFFFLQHMFIRLKLELGLLGCQYRIELKPKELHTVQLIATREQACPEHV